MDSSSRAKTVLAALALVIAVLVAYANSLHAPFVFDDRAAILENPALQPGASWSDILIPPSGGQTVAGRPLVNLSLAINARWSGTNPWSYHLLNIALHACAAITLFGLARRTLCLLPSGNNDAFDWKRSATSLAFLIALLWSLHPLQTAAVTYVVQRAEGLAALFVLLTLYCFVRGMASPFRRWWFSAAVLACAAGVTAKETAVVAPVLVLLHDRTFIAGNFASALRQRRWFYVLLATTWVLLAALVVQSGARGGTVGFASEITSWQYLMTQAQALVTYLKLTIWPHPLVFDYGDAVVSRWTDALLPGFAVVLLLVATGVALRRSPRIGFLGAWWFVLLAPTSSVIPVASQTMAEHRVYLPLAAVAAGLVLTFARWLGRSGFALIVMLSAGFAGLTVARNHTYASEVRLWQQTTRHAPNNLRAHVNLGSALFDADRPAEAVTAYHAAERLEPAAAEVHAALCHAYTQLGRLDEAVSHGQQAARLAPHHANVQMNLAGALLRRGDLDAAIEHYRLAHQTEPEATDIRTQLVDALLQRARERMRTRDATAAHRDLQEAQRLSPENPAVHFALGNLLAATNHLADAVTAYRSALARAPDLVAARNNLANALLLLGRIDEAITAYEQVLGQRPDDASVRANLDMARAERARRTPTGR